MGRRPKDKDQKYVRLTVLLPPSIHARLQDDVEHRRRFESTNGAWTLSRLGRMWVAAHYGMDEEGNPQQRP